MAGKKLFNRNVERVGAVRHAKITHDHFAASDVFYLGAAVENLAYYINAHRAVLVGGKLNVFNADNTFFDVRAVKPLGALQINRKTVFWRYGGIVIKRGFFFFLSGFFGGFLGGGLRSVDYFKIGFAAIRNLVIGAKGFF